MTAPTQRTGSRVILLDPAGRILLINERIEGGDTHWLTPGGGVEPGEDLIRAAVRETWEELGLRIDLPDGTAEVFRQRRNWSWAGRHYDQTDHFFVARVVGDVVIEPGAPTELEQQTLIGFRWWSVAELDRTDERIEPPDLAALVAGLVAVPPAGG